MKSEDELRLDIVEVGRRIWTRGYVAAYDGNISARLNDHEILTTPTMVSKGFMSPEMIVKVDTEGNPVGPGKPSSEIALHVMAYRERPDVGAVVHAHPAISTGFGVARESLEAQTMPEVLVHLGSIPLTEYATPASPEVPEAARPFIKDNNAMILANHGSLTVGADVFEAYYRLEIVEHFALITLVARILGGQHSLTPAQIALVMAKRAV
jgi:L-fuculose-phosphate aldolase